MDAVELRHRDVHHDHVRRECGDLVDGLQPITGLADNGDICCAVDQSVKTFAQQRVVVHHKHCRFLISGCRHGQSLRIVHGIQDSPWQPPE